MDPLTHGITGALLGKGFFSERQGRMATFAATLGAVFPDIDVVADLASRDPLAIVKYHRSITHSFVALPFFAALLAWLTRRVAGRRGIEAPSWGMLTLIYGVGIASHIALDGTTSFGTRIWMPISDKRVAWDLMFIIDFILSSCVLVPQVVAWVYAASHSRAARARALRMWAVFSLATVAVWGVAVAAGYPFHLWVVALVSAISAAVFLGPSVGGWGFRVKRSSWCRAGICLAAGYVCLCGLAHHAAIQRVEEFARTNRIDAERVGALPVPPSPLDWGGAIRTSDGVYQARFDLRKADHPAFDFVPDSPPNAFIERALELPEVRLYWSFARFPTIRSEDDGDRHIVDFSEHRFTNGGRRTPQPFSYRVAFNGGGAVIEQGWLENGVFLRGMRRMPTGGSESKAAP